MRILLVAILIIMTIQGWFGDTVNIFVAPANGITPPPFSMAGFFQLVNSSSFLLIYHTYEGVLLVVLAVVSVVLSFTWSKSRAVRICTIIAMLAVISAGVGGFLFVLSGYANGGNSAQMGGSFIGAYAFYFMALYYAK
jgi:hypothetical protein